MGLPAFITKNRHGTYYFRLVIPKELKGFFPAGQREIRRSLGTTSRKEAIRLARIFWTATILGFDEMRRMEFPRFNGLEFPRFNGHFLNYAALRYRCSNSTGQRLPIDECRLFLL